MSDEPAPRRNKESVTQSKPVSSDNINYDLLAAAILRQLQTMSSNLTNSTDDTMEATQPGVQNQGDTSTHVHSVAMQQTAASASSKNQPQQNIADLVLCYNRRSK